jgi:dTDP-4-amino-4,6-dideoxygalactose transaminase
VTCPCPDGDPLPMANVQLFRPRYRIDEVLAEVRECLECGWTGVGRKTLEFERAWCEYTDLPRALLVSSATAGLHLALRVLGMRRGWKPGNEVVTTPLTFVSTNHAILYEHLEPVFADVDGYGCLDPERAEAAVTTDTRAVMFVGLGGNYGQLDRVREVCDRNRLALVLDAAHMAGTRFRGLHVGREADATVFSFQSVKNLPTVDGGMLCFAEAEDDVLARTLSWMGISRDTYQRSQGAAYAWRYDVDVEGFKYHGNSVTAAMGLVGLRYLEEDNERRRLLCAAYDVGLEAVDGIDPVPTRPGCVSSRHLYQVCVRDRERLIQGLAQRGVEAGVHYRPNTDYPMYAFRRGAVPIAERLGGELLSLPLHPAMELSDAAHVTAAVKDAL